MDLLDLLDKDHLRPRKDDKRLETSIVNVRHLQKQNKLLRKDEYIMITWSQAYYWYGFYNM